MARRPLLIPASPPGAPVDVLPAGGGPCVQRTHASSAGYAVAYLEPGDYRVVVGAVGHC